MEKFAPGKATPFRPNSFDEGNEAARVTCSITAEGDLAERAQAADEQLIAIICGNSTYYLGKEMKEAEIRAAYCPLYRTHDKYAASLKCNINRQGARATRFWTTDGSRTTEPEDWTMTTFRSPSLAQERLDNAWSPAVGCLCGDGGRASHPDLSSVPI